MTKKLFFFLLVVLSFVLIACSSVKVLQHTGDTAIIEAKAETKARAILKAEDKARELFGDFTETREPNCSPSIVQNNAPHAGISTEWICAIYVQKKR